MEIEVIDLHCTYPGGVDAVRGVNLAIPSGQRVAIVGQNGAGKTTLVSHLNGIFRPSAGKVRVGDWITTDKDVAELAHRVGYVFQHPDEQLFARKVVDDVAFGPRNLGFPPDVVDQAVAEALDATGLSAEAGSHPYHLSLSQRKLVALASVLAMRTPVVVLDEPTTGQDERGVQRIARIVAASRDAGRTVIAITHDMDFCAENFDRVVVMAQGRVQADGGLREVFRQAETLASAAVEPPGMVRLAEALGWSETPLTVAEFTAARVRSGDAG